MENTIKINFRDLETKEFPVRTTLYEISKSFTSHFNYEILIGKINNKLADLSDKVNQSCQVDFYDRSSVSGNSVYARSLIFMFVVAVRNVLGEDVNVIVQHSVERGIYCEITNHPIDESYVQKIEEEMSSIQKKGFLFSKINASRYDAIRYFQSKNRFDKVKVLKYISNSNINLYRLDDYYDYFYGEMAYNTNAINDFKLTYLKKNSVVLSFPDITNPEMTLDFAVPPLLYQTFQEYIEWGRCLGITNAADLNERAITGKYDEIIRFSEAYFNRQLANIAERIRDSKKKIKLVLIAGPTSSGKTTTAQKLEVYLQSCGIQTHQISLDNYFKDRLETPKDEDGVYDFESIEALDVDLFNKHLAELLSGEVVWVPEYNFVSGKKEYKRRRMQMGKNDIIVVEGLHGLNEELTMSVERKNKFKIFISPLTQLNIDNHTRIHTTDTRKLRRIIRDNKFRDYSAGETLQMWGKIRAGEEKYVYPYQEEADVVLNSALVYEIAAIKVYAEPLLFSVEETDAMYPEALRLINFLRNFLPIPSDTIPQDSVLREFIGGSAFRE